MLASVAKKIGMRASSGKKTLGIAYLIDKQPIWFNMQLPLWFKYAFERMISINCRQWPFIKQKEMNEIGQLFNFITTPFNAFHIL